MKKGNWIALTILTLIAFLVVTYIANSSINQRNAVREIYCELIKDRCVLDDIFYSKAGECRFIEDCDFFKN